MKLDIQIVYQNNEEIKEYVDRYAKCYHISVEEALTHKIVEEVANYLLHGC